MPREIETQDQEQLSHLSEDIKAIISNARESVTIEMIAAKYLVGEAIATSVLYAKHAKTQPALYADIEDQTGIKTSTLVDCVKLYEAYPRKKAKSIADELFTQFGAWRNVRKALYGGDPNAVRTDDEPRCKHCPIHCSHK